MAPGTNSRYVSTNAINNGGNSDGDPPLPIPNREVKPFFVPPLNCNPFPQLIQLKALSLQS